MARQRRDIVTESRTQLLDLQRRSSGSRRSRLKAIRLIKERPNDSLRDIALSMGVSARVLERWWAMYRQGGLNALLETKQRGGYRPSKVDDAIIEEIARKREKGEILSQRDLQQWLSKDHGLKVSRSGAGYLLKTRVAAMHSKAGLQRGQDIPSSNGETTGIETGRPKRKVESLTTAGSRYACDATPEGVSPDPAICTNLWVNLINNLPRHHDTAEWVAGFRNALYPVLRDVTRISVDVNSACDLLHPEKYAPDIAFSRRLGVPSNEGEVFVGVTQEKGEMAQYAIEKLREQGAPLAQFHPVPLWREYYYEGTAYLGSLIFWQSKALPQISPATIRLIDQLEPFIVFMLSDYVTRYDYAHPFDRIFHDILSAISAEYKLSFQERRALGLQLQGEPYKSIALQMNISQNAVRKHLTSVHQKTGTNSSLQLFARYFTPRLATARNSPS